MTLNPIPALSVLGFNMLDMGILLPAVAGIVGGISVVGLIHFVLRPRKAAAPPVSDPKPSDPFLDGSPTEQRKSFRRKGQPVQVFIRDFPQQGQQLKGLVLNRSLGGLCIQVDQPVEPETQISIRPTNAPHIAPWVEVVVKNSRHGDLGHELGCEFLKTPPWPVLMMFG